MKMQFARNKIGLYLKNSNVQNPNWVNLFIDKPLNYNQDNEHIVLRMFITRHWS